MAIENEERKVEEAEPMSETIPESEVDGSSIGTACTSGTQPAAPRATTHLEPEEDYDEQEQESSRAGIVLTEEEEALREQLNSLLARVRTRTPENSDDNGGEGSSSGRRRSPIVMLFNNGRNPLLGQDPNDPAGPELQVDWRFGETVEFEAEQFGWSPEFLDEASLRQDFASIAAEAAAVAAERLRRPDLVVQVATNDPQQQQQQVNNADGQSRTPVNRGPHPIFDQPTQRPANQHVAVATEARMGTRQGLDINNNEI